MAGPAVPPQRYPLNAMTNSIRLRLTSLLAYHALLGATVAATPLQQPNVLVVISDWHIFRHRTACLSLAKELDEAGVTGIGLNALDADGRAVFDESFARELAGQGWFVATLTPKRLAEHVGKLIA